MKFPPHFRHQEHRDRHLPDKKALFAQRRISYMLRRLALDHTTEGTLESFSAKVAITPGSLSRFVREGRVPQRAAEHIEAMCGRDAIRKEQLMYPMEYEEEEDDL
jgi:hypothetical protein